MKKESKLDKIKNNKILTVISNIIYTIIFIIVLFALIIVVMQRVTNNEISLYGYRIFVIATGSMVPEYNVGDVLLAKETDVSELKVGDDIVYKGEDGSFSGKTVTHRIISIEKNEDGNYVITTQGVANNASDPEISSDQIVGKIIYKIKILSFLEKGLSNNYVVYFVIFIPIALIIFKQIRNVIKEMNEEEQDDIEDKNMENIDKNQKENNKEDDEEENNKKE